MRIGPVSPQVDGLVPLFASMVHMKLPTAWHLGQKILKDEATAPSRLIASPAYWSPPPFPPIEVELSVSVPQATEDLVEHY